MPQDLMSMLSPLALMGMMIAMCFRPLDWVVKIAVLSALLYVVYGYYEFHTHGHKDGLVMIAYAIVAGYVAFALIQLFVLRIFGFKAAPRSSFVLQGAITDTGTSTQSYSDTRVSSDMRGGLQAHTQGYSNTKEVVFFQNDRDAKITAIQGPGYATSGSRGDRAMIAGFENYAPLNILYNETRGQSYAPPLPSVTDTLGMALLLAIPFLGQAIQFCLLVFSYIIPFSNWTMLGESRGPFDRRHLVVSLALSAWPLSVLWEKFSLGLAMWAYIFFAGFHLVQMLLIRDEHKRFNDMLWMKIQYVLVKDKLV